MDDQTRIEIEAAAFRRLQQHLMEERKDVQNIDMMNLAGFCRNCLSRWYQEAANARGIEMDKDAGREAFYGMPFSEWKAKYQTEATPDQQAALPHVSLVPSHRRCCERAVLSFIGKRNPLCLIGFESTLLASSELVCCLAYC